MFEKQPFLKDLAERRSLFEARAEFLAEIRRFFSRRRFLEVDPPALVPSAGMEPHLDPFEAKGWSSGRTAFLPTSPEFYLKKLLASGVERCFALAPAFRDETPSKGHSPEFLMLEWYRARRPLKAILKDCDALLNRVGRRFLEMGVLERGESRCDFTAGIEVWPLSRAFETYVGRDWRDLRKDRDWREAARLHGASADDSWSKNDCFSYLQVARIEPGIAKAPRPVALWGYPPFQGALAREDPREPGVIERFELYAAGVELANAYAELIDEREQRRRYQEYQEERCALGKPPHPPDERFLQAAGQLPPCSGIALGADRLLALFLGRSLANVRHGEGC